MSFGKMRTYTLTGEFKLVQSISGFDAYYTLWGIWCHEDVWHVFKMAQLPDMPFAPRSNEHIIKIPLESISQYTTEFPTEEEAREYFNEGTA